MNVLIVGLGSIARKHIAALRSLDPEVQIYALRSTRFSNSVDGVTDLFSMKEVEEYSFDFAIISNPTSEHQKTIQQMGVLNIPLLSRNLFLINWTSRKQLQRLNEKCSNLCCM